VAGIESRTSLLERHQAALAALEVALEGLRPDDLDRAAGPAEWTVRQIIHHVADTEVIAGGRLRLILAEDGIAVPGYDQEELAKAAGPEARSVESSLALVRAVHQANLELLAALTPSAWSRAGVHNEIGQYSLEVWLERRADHLAGHGEQIERARGLPAGA
jgi:hypothetical protein